MKRPPGPEMLKRAQGMRQAMTPQEETLWRCLRDRRLEGFKFRRQMWLTGYIADFACPEARLVVEADGSQHADRIEYDQQRAASFARSGWRTLRFWNNEINEDLDAVLTAISAALNAPPHPASLRSATLSPEGRGGRKKESLSLQGRGRGPRCAASWEGEGL